MKGDLRLYGDQKLNDEQRYFFYEKIFDYYSDLRHEDKQIDICCREIMKLQEKLDVYADAETGEIETPSEKRKSKFQELLERLETLPSYKEKIACLIKEKTEYKQSGIKDWFDSPNFGGKCQLEIDKLEKLMRLETPSKQATDGIKKHKDLTIDRAILLMKHLAPRLTGCDQKRLQMLSLF